MPYKAITFGGILKFILVISIMVAFVAYILFQSRFLLGGPHITLTEGQATVTSDPLVSLEGWADNIVAITINDRPIMTTEHGYFKEDIILPIGYNIVSIEARDRYGRSRNVERTFIYTPSKL